MLKSSQYWMKTSINIAANQDLYTTDSETVFDNYKLWVYTYIRIFRTGRNGLLSMVTWLANRCVEGL